MICDTIKQLRENAGYSQSVLAKKLNVTRSAVNAWEMGLSCTDNAICRGHGKNCFGFPRIIFWGLSTESTLVLDGLSEQEKKHSLFAGFDYLTKTVNEASA